MTFDDGISHALPGNSGFDKSTTSVEGGPAIRRGHAHLSPRLPDDRQSSVEKALTFPIDQCPYDTVYVDLTYRCNLSCHFCYNPVRTLPDMDLGYFEEACARLPRTTLLRLLGGEPTLHPRFFDMLETAHRHGHVVSVVTNGLKFTDLTYAREVKALGIPLVIGMSMDGGRADNAVYREIVNADCAKAKMRALDNMAVAGFKRVAIGAIVVRNLNEAVMPDLISVARDYAETVRYVHFRTAGAVGRWNEIYGRPYSAEDLKGLLRDHLGEDAVDRPYRMVRDGVHPSGGSVPLQAKTPERVCRGCCYEFWLDPSLQVSLIEFASENSALCWRRGKLANDFTVQPFFDHMIKFSEEIHRL